MSNEIVIDDLLGYWNSKAIFKRKGAPSWKNISPHSNPYSTISVSKVGGDGEGGIYFNGDNNYVDIYKYDITTSLDILNINEFTIEFMIDTISTNNEYCEIVSLISLSNTVNRWIYLSNTLGNKIVFDPFSNQSPLIIDYNVDKMFFSITYRKSLNEFKIFINGVYFDSYIPDNNDEFYPFGNIHTGIRFGSMQYSPLGIIDCIRFYNRALTPEEVGQNYTVDNEIGTGSDYFYMFDNDGTIVISDYFNIEQKEVIIPSKIRGVSVTKIHEYTFMGLGLTNVVFPNTIIDIGRWAFTDNNLSSLILPDSIKRVGATAFRHSNINTIHIPHGLERIEYDAFYDNPIQHVSIPSSVNYIASFAFARCDLRSASIKARDIDSNAFTGNKYLKHVELDKVEQIGFLAFYQCDIENIIFPNSLEMIGEQSFQANNIQYATFLNPNTYLYANIFLDNSVEVTIQGFNPSTAQTYATNYGHNFIDLNTIDELKPIVNVLSATRKKLSNQPNMDESSILFKFGFDQDVLEWKAVLLGASHDTGTVIDSGGFVKGGNELTTLVNSSQLYGEGLNRINFYGKSTFNVWTPYNDDRVIENPIPPVIHRTPFIYGRGMYGTTIYAKLIMKKDKAIYGNNTYGTTMYGRNN